MIISYMGYSTPKCTCNGHQTHSSKTCMFLLKCLDEMDENVTHPFPIFEPSLTPSRMPKHNVRKIPFSKQKVFVLENTLPSFGKIYWTTSEVNCWVILRSSHRSASKMNCWTTLQGNSSENLPLKFLSQPFSFFFHVMHSHLPF